MRHHRHPANDAKLKTAKNPHEDSGKEGLRILAKMIVRAHFKEMEKKCLLEKDIRPKVDNLKLMVIYLVTKILK